MPTNKCNQISATWAEGFPDSDLHEGTRSHNCENTINLWQTYKYSQEPTTYEKEVSYRAQEEWVKNIGSWHTRNKYENIFQKQTEDVKFT